MSSANPLRSSRIVGELAELDIQVAKATVEKCMVRPKKPPSPTWRAFLENHVRDLVAVDFFAVLTVTFKVLFVFVVLAHARRRIVHFNITHQPTARWTAQHVSEAFPWEVVPRYLLRDRDRVYHRWRCHRSLAMDCPAPRPVQGPEVGQVVEVAEAGRCIAITSGAPPELNSGMQPPARQSCPHRPWDLIGPIKHFLTDRLSASRRYGSRGKALVLDQFPDPSTKRGQTL